MIYWIEQRYVFPVEAESFEAAEDIAFKQRALIAEECGPVTSRRHSRGMLTRVEREGWDLCEPYKEIP